MIWQRVCVAVSRRSFSASRSGPLAAWFAVSGGTAEWPALHGHALIAVVIVSDDAGSRRAQSYGRTATRRPVATAGFAIIPTGTVTALVADVGAIHYVMISGSALPWFSMLASSCSSASQNGFRMTIPLEIEISGQHDHVANRHTAWPRQHEHHHVRHFAGLQQTSRLPGFLQLLRRPVREQCADDGTWRD